VAAITGTKKVALLLMAMDPHSASELLKVVKPATATDIATEMAYLNSSGSQEAEEFSHDVVKEFSTLLSGNDQDWGLGFVKQMLDDALGMERDTRDEPLRIGSSFGGRAYAGYIARAGGAFS